MGKNEKMEGSESKIETGKSKWGNSGKMEGSESKMGKKTKNEEIS